MENGTLTAETENGQRESRDYRLIKSKRQKTQVVDRFGYRYSRNQKDKESWLCVNYASSKCSGRVKVSEKDGQITKGKAHNPKCQKQQIKENKVREVVDRIAMDHQESSQRVSRGLWSLFSEKNLVDVERERAEDRERRAFHLSLLKDLKIKDVGSNLMEKILTESDHVDQAVFTYIMGLWYELEESDSEEESDVEDDDNDDNDDGDRDGVRKKKGGKKTREEEKTFRDSDFSYPKIL